MIAFHVRQETRDFFRGEKKIIHQKSFLVIFLIQQKHLDTTAKNTKSEVGVLGRVKINTEII